MLARWAVPLACMVACDTPHTTVTFDNGYPATSGMVIYAARWSSLTVTTPIPPGSSSETPSPVLGASDNTAYVVIAPGWDPTSALPPTSFIVLQSTAPYAIHIDEALDIPVDDSTFGGDCAASSKLSQDQADLITQRLFPTVFAGWIYDASTCSVRPAGDSGT